MASVRIHYSSAFAFLQISFLARSSVFDVISVPAEWCQVIPTLFAKMVLRYLADILLSAPPIISVMDMLLSWIALHFVTLATLNDLSYQERAMSTASVFTHYPISWTSTDLFCPLDNNVAVTFMACYMGIKCVLTSELVQVATWQS